MPDWLTHVLSAWALWNFLSPVFNMPYRGVFIAGSLLPDIKTVDMLNPGDIEAFLSVFHTPVGALVTSGIISMTLFRDRIKQVQIFIALGAGSLFHLLLDLMVKSLDGRVMLFFPFSFGSYSFNILAQEDLTFLYLAFAALLISIFVGRYCRDFFS